MSERSIPDNFSFLFDELDNPVVIADNNFQLEWVSPAFEKTYGYTFQEFIQARGTSLFTASYNSEISQALDLAIRQKRTVKYESRNVTKDGRELWISSTIKPVYGKNGLLNKIIIIDLDVHEKKALESKLALTQTILDNIGTLVLVADSNGEIVYVSPSVTKMVGYSSWELIGNGWWTFSRRTQWDAEREKRFVAQCAAGALPVSHEPYEKMLICRDGSIRWVLWTDTKGPDDLLIGVGQDITERKRSEEIIHAKTQDITNSIYYAHRIQNAILPSVQDMELLPESFVFLQPKDIVSGDFYWTHSKDDLVYLAVADCTGHGVPGALMSMLGIAFLNEITAVSKKHTPAKILDLLREKIIHELKQTGISGENKDGMDISLLRYNKKKGELQWSGANNSMYVISNNTLKEFKADKQPIGYHLSTKQFTNHTFKIKKGDTVYLFTDGYADQFGGPKGKKMKYKQFEKILLETSQLPMKLQQEELSKCFENWRLNYEQLDDVCVVGVKL